MNIKGQSTLHVKNAARMAEAKTVLDMTWARQHTPETQQVIVDAYKAIGKELGAIVVRVGLAWQNFLAERQTHVLRDRDQSPPRRQEPIRRLVFF